MQLSAECNSFITTARDKHNKHRIVAYVSTTWEIFVHCYVTNAMQAASSANDKQTVL